MPHREVARGASGPGRRLGPVLRKTRRRDPRALDYGRWTVRDVRHQADIAHGSSLDAVERFLTGQ